MDGVGAGWRKEREGGGGRGGGRGWGGGCITFGLRTDMHMDSLTVVDAMQSKKG